MIRNILDGIAAVIIVTFVTTILSGHAPAVAVGPVQDSTLILPDTVSFESSGMWVNRTHKGDRIVQMSAVRQPSNLFAAPEAVPASTQRMLPGCEPAFSSVADPLRAHIYRRCVV
jgi:hypothetical protein